jgi:mono/diheme cytochrome c family protein
LKQFILLFIILSSTYIHANVAEGKKVYTANCAICHTVNGGYGLGPDFNIVSYTKRKEEIEEYAKDPYAWYESFGYSANAMPTLPLTDKEFKDVSEYIDSLQPFKKWMIKKEN